MKAFCRIIFIIISSILCEQCFGAQSINFSIRNTDAEFPVHGQIDWPSGQISAFRGQVIVLVSAGGPVDRDGWLLRALDTVWRDRKPLKDIADALVRNGFAVVRFDSPGVRPPAKRCREEALRGNVSSTLISECCIDISIVEKVSVTKYIESIENVIAHVKNITSGVKEDFILFGFSEGLWHAASIAERGRVGVQALVSLGGGVESLETITKWQFTERLIDTLPEFDLDMNGEISNEEIRKGYGAGIGNFASNIGDWLSPAGVWNQSNVSNFHNWVRQGYENIRSKSAPYSQIGTLHWEALGDGYIVPDITDSFQNYHILGSHLPLDILTNKRVPALFIWGGKDSQVRVQYQSHMIKDAVAKIPSLKYHIYADRHHLLSKNGDMDWFEAEFANELSDLVRTFVDGFFSSQPDDEKIKVAKVQK